MDSQSLESAGFGQWMEYDRSILDVIPKATGVYAFRARHHQSWGSTDTDIQYIGRAATSISNLNQVMRQYFSPGSGNATRLRIGLLATAGKWQVSWKTDDAAEHLECHLLTKFKVEHGRLPSQNKRMPC